jgi:hypothetical protein
MIGKVRKKKIWRGIKGMRGNESEQALDRAGLMHEGIRPQLSRSEWAPALPEARRTGQAGSRLG